MLTGRYDIPEGEPGGPRLERKTWCERRPTPSEFTFTDPTHAALNGAQGGRLVACPECVEKIHAALANGRTPPSGAVESLKRLKAAIERLDSAYLDADHYPAAVQTLVDLARSL